MKRWLRRLHKKLYRWARLHAERNPYHRILFMRLWREEDLLEHIQEARAELMKGVVLRELLDDEQISRCVK